MIIKASLKLVEEYKEQIKAVEESGMEEWLFWNPGGVYKWDAFIEDGVSAENTETTKNE